MRPTILLLSLCLLAACRKSDTFKTARMLRGDWRMTEKYIDDGSDTGYRGNRVPGSCMIDDVTTFTRSGAYILNANGTTCVEAHDKQCYWKLSDERTIVFYSSDNPTGTTSHIDMLSEQKLVLSETRSNGVITLKGSFVYERRK